VFKSLNNNKISKSDKKKEKKKQDNDYMLPETTIKDMYITQNYGSRSENGQGDQNNPSFVNFQNMTPDPDLAGKI